MGRPRHLWSGDWRRESEADAPAQPPAREAREAIGLSATQRPRPAGAAGSVRVGAGAKKPSRGAMIAAAATALLALAIGVPLATLGDPSPSHQPTTPYVQAPVYQSANYQSGNGVYTITQATPAPTTPHQRTGP